MHILVRNWDITFLMNWFLILQFNLVMNDEGETFGSQRFTYKERPEGLPSEKLIFQLITVSYDVSKSLQNLFAKCGRSVNFH